MAAEPRSNLVARLAPSSGGAQNELRVVITNRAKRPVVLACNHPSTLKVPPTEVLTQLLKRERCDKCAVKLDLWLCLSCLGVFCSRDEGLGHGWSHYQESGHCVAMSLNTLSVWCYGHEMYCEHDFYPDTLAVLFKEAHRIKHGESPFVPETIPDFEFLDDLAITTSCPHTDSVVNKGPSPPMSLSTPCEACGSKDENWVCLTCLRVFCGRFSEKHMQAHHSPGHDVCLSLSDLSIWCNACQQYLDTFANPSLNALYLYFHQIKFAGLPPQALKRSHSLAMSDDAVPLSTPSTDYGLDYFRWED